MKKKMQIILTVTIMMVVFSGCMFYVYLSYQFLLNDLIKQVAEDNRVVGQQILNLLYEKKIKNSKEKEKIQLLQNLCNEIKLPNGGFICATNLNGDLLAYPNRKPGEKAPSFKDNRIIDISGVNKDKFGNLKMNEYVGQMHRDSKTDIIASFPIESSEIKLLVHQSKDVIVKSVKKRVTPLLYVGLILTLILGLITFLSTNHIVMTYESKLEIEKKKSDDLLHSILPETIADELKKNRDENIDVEIAKRFDNVTVCFVDIVGFTSLSVNMEPEDLVKMLNKIFSEFDRLTEKYSIEKIKTIGDAYMAVAGLPIENRDHAKIMANFSLEIIDCVKKINEMNNINLNVRIGLNSGVSVAGVIGKKKFSYDLWGDTVNTASRMESHGVPGEIHISESTYALIKNDFKFEKREKMHVKGKGDMQTYIILGT